MPLPAGTRLTHYEIRSHLGSGGMGDVYRARDLTLGRDVALKLLPPHVAGDADRLRRFEQEARSASALNHPAIVAIYELGAAEGQPFISMELVEGQTVRELLANGALPPRRALQVAAPMADALAKAHAAGLVHRDLKPENLMVTNDGHAKILDFGLAKLVIEPADLAELSTVAQAGTRPGTVLGTTAYMSPEQASGKPVDRRSDQFSFGLVLYEMLTGRRAFSRPTAAETMSAIIRDEPPPMESGGATLPAPLRWIVERCLAKAPDERYASTQDLARDLATAHDRFSELSGSAAAVEAPRRASRRGAAVAWLVAGVFASAALVLAITGSWRGGPVEPLRPVRLTVAPPEGGAFVMGVGWSPFALSPDGRHLVVSATHMRRRQLWLRSFDSLELRPIAGTEGGSSPFWSPDSLTIGFFADQKLKRVPIAGGEPTTICPVRGSGGATWNRDDVIVFAPGVESALYRVSAHGGTPTPVTTLDRAHDESLHAAPVFLPDGRHFLLFVLGKDNAGLHVGSIDSPTRQRIMPDVVAIGVGAPDWVFFVRNRALVAQRLDLERLEFTGDATLVADGIALTGPTPAVAASSRAVVYWAGAQNVMQLTWFRRDGTPDGAVGPPGGYMNVALSPDGQQIAVDRFDTDPSVWLIDVARGAPSRATFGSLYESTPVWAPDGRSFAFASARELPPNLFLKRLDGSTDDERLVRSRLQSFPQSWSGAAGAIVYDMIDPDTRDDIWMLPMTGERTPVPVLQTPYREMYARVSPDGRWLAYVSDESGQLAVYVTTFPTPGRKWRVSPGPGGYPVWRPDGRELVFRSADGTLMAVPVGGASELQVGSPMKLFQPTVVPGNLGVGTFYDIARDGRFLVNVFVERRTPPATVILNWSPAAAK